MEGCYNGTSCKILSNSYQLYSVYFFSVKEDIIYDKSEMFDLLYVKNSAYGMLQKYA